MAGIRRLDNFAAIVAQVITEGITGHIIETGVWKGGASFLAAKLLMNSEKVNVDLFSYVILSEEFL